VFLEQRLVIERERGAETLRHRCGMLRPTGRLTHVVDAALEVVVDERESDEEYVPGDEDRLHDPG